MLLDIKAGSERVHRALTLRPLAPTLRFAERLAARGNTVWLRYVLVPGFTDEEAEVETVAALAAELENVERVDVLPFHSSARRSTPSWASRSRSPTRRRRTARPSSGRALRSRATG